MITVLRELEYSVKNENKLYRESHVSRAFDKLPGNLRAFYGSLHFFSVWGMNKYCAVAVCHNGNKERPDRVSGNYHSKIKGPREMLNSSVTSPGKEVKRKLLWLYEVQSQSLGSDTTGNLPKTRTN